MEEEIRKETEEQPVPEEQTSPEADQSAETTEAPTQPDALEELRAAIDKEHESYLRLAAEYDNYRKRSARERDELYTVIRAETVGKFLPVYDNLERALTAETADKAYQKGVEMTMIGLQQVLESLGVTIFGEVGESFDPQRHNAVMHEDKEELGENVISEVFQKGFAVGEKVVRFAMVKVAN